MPNCKPDNVFQYYYTNPNGFSLDTTDGGNFQQSSAELHLIDVDMASVAELNLNTQKHSVWLELHLHCKDSATTGCLFQAA